MQARVYAHYILACLGPHVKLHLLTISRGWNNILNQVQAHELLCMHTIFLHAWDHISGYIHARTLKLGIKHQDHIKRIGKLNKVQARELVCMHTIFFLAWDHILG